MIPAPFDYIAPETLDEAVRALADHGEEAKLLAGGHSLLPLMKLRLANPKLLIDLRKIPGLCGVSDPHRRAHDTLPDRKLGAVEEKMPVAVSDSACDRGRSGAQSWHHRR